MSEFTDDIKEQLREPFHPSAITWRIQTYRSDGEGVLLVPYLEKRAIIDRLDDVFGPDGWEDELRLINTERTVTENEDDDKKQTVHRNELLSGYIHSLTVHFGDEGKTRSGSVTKQETAGLTDGSAIKGGATQSLRRVATKFGIGNYIGEVGEQWADLKDSGEHYATTIDGNAKYYDEPKLDDEYLPDDFSYDDYDAGTDSGSSPSGGSSNSSGSSSSNSSNSSSGGDYERESKEDSDFTDDQFDRTEQIPIKKAKNKGWSWEDADRDYLTWIADEWNDYAERRKAQLELQNRVIEVFDEINELVAQNDNIEPEHVQSTCRNRYDAEKKSEHTYEQAQELLSHIERLANTGETPTLTSNGAYAIDGGEEVEEEVDEVDDLLED